MVLTTKAVSFKTFTFTFLFAGINLQLNTVKMQQEIGIQFFNVPIIRYLQHQWYSNGVGIQTERSPIPGSNYILTN